MIWLADDESSSILRFRLGLVGSQKIMIERDILRSSVLGVMDKDYIRSSTEPVGFCLNVENIEEWISVCFCDAVLEMLHNWAKFWEQTAP